MKTFIAVTALYYILGLVNLYWFIEDGFSGFSQFGMAVWCLFFAIKETVYILENK